MSPVEPVGSTQPASAQPASTRPAEPARTDVPAQRAHRPVRHRPSSRFLRSELRLLYGRRRNLALLVVLAIVPILLGVVVRFSSGQAQPGEGPQFLSAVTDNGLFLGLTALVTTLPLFLPLAVGVVSGDAVAGEAASGTLRYLLVTPVDRARLLIVKFAAASIYTLGAALLVVIVGIITGLILFPHGDVALLSGTSVGYADAVGRALLVALYVGVSLLGLAAIGLFISTLTEVPVAAMATTVVVAIAVQIMDAVPQLDWLQPYLFSHRWLAFGDLLRDPIRWPEIVAGVLVQVGYVGVFGALAWARFTTKDVTS